MPLIVDNVDVDALEISTVPVLVLSPSADGSCEQPCRWDNIATKEAEDNLTGCLWMEGIVIQSETTHL